MNIMSGDIPVNIEIMQYDWWNVNDIYIKFDIDENKKIAEYQAEYTEITESGKKNSKVKGGCVDIKELEIVIRCFEQ